MAIRITEAAVVTIATALTLWLLPKSLPNLGGPLAQFQEELKQK